MEFTACIAGPENLYKAVEERRSQPQPQALLSRSNMTYSFPNKYLIQSGAIIVRKKNFRQERQCIKQDVLKVKTKQQHKYSLFTSLHLRSSQFRYK
jgi:hypothetical protein